MAWVVTDNIRGRKGDKGDTGSIASASAESVPAHEPAAVIMTGTEAVKHAHFRVPRGIPGMNAVPSDEGVAAYAAALGTQTRDVLNRAFLNYVVWDGPHYPARVPDAVNVFIGPVDPGLAMSGNDLWVNPDTATLSEVTAAMLDPTSALYRATKSVLPQDVSPLSILQGPNTNASFGSFAPNLVWATGLAKGGTNGLRVTGRIPDGWGSAELRYRWIHNASSGTSARLNTYYSLADTDSFARSFTETRTYSTPAMVLRTLSYGPFPVQGGQFFSASIVRLSDNASDTIDGPIGITDAWLVRMS